MRLDPNIKSLAVDDQIDAVATGISTQNLVVDSIQSNLKPTTINILNGQSGEGSSSTNDAHYQCSGAIKLPIKVTNVQSSNQNCDTLYQNSKSVACNAHACLGSIMAQPLAANIKSNEEILDQAADFLQQYFIHTKKSDSSDLAQRLAEIATEMEHTGTYTMTKEELLFGAKTAWRNASRCIGRIQWNKLDLHDARHVKTTSEMFDALCKHIQSATNGGNLRSSITVFPQRVHNREDFRVWNSQLISYAGYLQSDGSVIGDPARVEFTKICERLGWKGNNQMFDILPLVLSAPGEGVRLYEVPNDIVMRIKISHPKYKFFEELNLEWYALPAVADMQLDCGGLQFTGSPFNGWYMGTEIGARDLCDTQRYNLTENIAHLMGLDVFNPTTLWKDRALIEMNVAVLHSFQKANVTIVDHHSASESFMKHLKIEYKQRGGCPADWVWIVPPVSGSLTSVFHQEMINYSLRPSFEYQEKGWKTHKWTDSTVKPKYRLVSVAKAALWTVSLLTGVLSKRMRATILFATETGKSEAFAHKLTKLMKISFNVRTLCMENYDFNDLFKESLVIFVTSTFGDGEAPDNGKEFWSNISKVSQSELKLIGLKYAVFALGSTQYPSFCAFGKNIDKTLCALGASPVMPISLGDDLKGQELTFNKWGQDCYKNSCQSFDILIDSKDISETCFNDSPFEQQKIRITEVFTENNEQHLPHNLSRLHRKKVISCKKIAKVRLQAQHSERQTLLVRLTPLNAMTKNQLAYEPGDHLAIFPSNPKEVVNPLIAHFNKNGFKDTDCMVQVQHWADGKWTPDSRLPTFSIREALTQYLDITSPPTQKFLSYLKNMANDTWDSFRLTKLAKDIDDYEKWCSYNCPNLADILNQFPSVHISPELALTQLPLLQPRYYSVSSSRKVTPDEVQLTMDLVSYQIHGGVGPKRLGVCTSFIERSDSDILCFLRSAPTFRMSANKKLPIIMIGAGSGIAPFRSFWLERQADLQNGENCGKMFLFFGCRDSKLDNIYENELDLLLKKGVIHEIFMAFSAEKGKKKLYVQDQVFKQRALLQWLISKESAHIYVCGHSKMAKGVRKAFTRMFESEAKMSETEAQNFLSLLHNEGRYHEDVFGQIH